ncbi:MAG: hypothetical protein WC779_00410 [Candidatus Omnitrophota bacterium]|jgi:hypothetical protein
MVYKIFKIAFAVWIALWVMFGVRELFIKGAAKEYGKLFFRSLEGKHSYLTGDKLYELITAANKKMPPNATYKLIGVEKDSIEVRRVAYYLYPHFETDDADFLIIYDSRGDVVYEGYDIVESLDSARCVMKKRGAQ